MGERVNIQYSVDIDDLGDEIIRLIKEAFVNLNNVADASALPDREAVLSLRTIQMIDEVRQELGNIDLRLSDAVNLVNGYIAYQTDIIDRQQTGVVAEQAQQQPETGGTVNDLSNLRERVQELAHENAN